MATVTTPPTSGGTVSRRPTARGGQSVKRLKKGFSEPVRATLNEAGEIAIFGTRTFKEIPGSFRYSAEILRQTGLIIAGSAVVLIGMQFVIGLMCATEANYVLRGYGATAYSGVFTAFCGLREMSPYMFGYILAAKVGCGLVAELGSMRINNEFDAMESLGIDPMRYVVATRLMAVLIAVPLIYMIGFAVHSLADFVVIVAQIKEVSQGGWEGVHWAFIRPQDIFLAEVKVVVFAILIVIVAMYYGYTARGGPVGVGTATAKSMILNLVLIHIASSLMSMMFWGLNPATPVGG